MYAHTFLIPILDVPTCIDGKDERSTLFFSVSIPNMRTQESRDAVTEIALKLIVRASILQWIHYYMQYYVGQ